MRRPPLTLGRCSRGGDASWFSDLVDLTPRGRDQNDTGEHRPRCEFHGPAAWVDLGGRTTVLALVAGGSPDRGGAWWWLEPGGFPWGHPRFWSNRVLPGLAVLWGLAVLASLHREDRRRLLIWLPAMPAAWLAAAVTARLVFPITFAWLWLAPLGIALAMATPFRRGSDAA